MKAKTKAMPPGIKAEIKKLVSLKLGSNMALAGGKLVMIVRQAEEMAEDDNTGE